MGILKKAKNRFIWAMGEGLVGKRFSAKAWGPRLDPKIHIDKLGMVVDTCKPCVAEMRIGRALKFTGLTAKPNL